MPPSPPPDLIASAAREARNMFIAGLVCVPFGAVLTGVGAVAPCFFILGPILLIAGLVCIPVGAYQWYNPMSHSSIRRLGPTPEARARAVDDIEYELRGGDAETFTLAKNDYLTATPHWLVRHGGNLLVTATRDVLWAYKLVTTRKRYGIEVSRTVQVVVKTRHDKHELPATEANAPEILAFIHNSAPAAFYGYDAARERLSDAALARQVDERLASLGDGAFRKASEPRAISTYTSGGSDIPTLNPAPPRNRNVGMYIVGGVGGMLLLTVACAALCVGAGVMANAEKKKTAALAPACSGVPVPTAANETLSPLAHVAVMEADGSAWEASLSSLPGVPVGDTTATAGFVLCLDEAKEVVAETCDYDGGLTVTRKRSLQTGHLVNAYTGQTIGTQEVYGELPSECPDSITASRTIEGSDVSLGDWSPVVQRWLGGR